MTKDCKEIAQMYGLEDDQLFINTYTMYEQQKGLLQKLKKSIDEHGPIVEKTYVKGRANLTANPAIDAYNKTVSAINKTIQTLKKMLKEAPVDPMDKSEEDKLHELLGIDE